MGLVGWQIQFINEIISIKLDNFFFFASLNKKKKGKLQFLLKINANTAFFLIRMIKIFYHIEKKNISEPEIRDVHRIRIITKS